MSNSTWQKLLKQEFRSEKQSAKILTSHTALARGFGCRARGNPAICNVVFLILPYLVSGSVSTSSYFDFSALEKLKQYSQPLRFKFVKVKLIQESLVSSSPSVSLKVLFWLGCIRQISLITNTPLVLFFRLLSVCFVSCFSMRFGALRNCNVLYEKTTAVFTLYSLSAHLFIFFLKK